MLVPRFIAATLAFIALNGAIAASPLGSPQISGLSGEDFCLSDTIKREGKPSSWWLARAYQLGRPEIVVCGSSQIGGLQAADANLTGKAVDFVENHHCPTIEKGLEERLGAGAPYVFLSALPGAMISDHFAIARALYREKGAPPLVVLTISPRDFIDNSLPCAGSTEPYRYFSRFSDLSAYTNLAFNKPWSRLEYFTSNQIPARRLETMVTTAWQNTIDRLLPSFETKEASPGERALAGEVDGKQQIQKQLKFVMGGYEGNIRPGQAVLTPNLPQIFVDNSRDYRRRYRNTHPDTYDVQMRYMQEFLSYLKQENCRVLVLGMPLTANNREILDGKFWQRYLQDIEKTCRKNDSRFLNLIADPRFDNSDFCDTVHLNAAGGKKLADIVAETVCGTPELRAALTECKNSIAGKAPLTR